MFFGDVFFMLVYNGHHADLLKAIRVSGEYNGVFAS